MIESESFLGRVSLSLRRELEEESLGFSALANKVCHITSSRTWGGGLGMVWLQQSFLIGAANSLDFVDAVDDSPGLIVKCE